MHDKLLALSAAFYLGAFVFLYFSVLKNAHGLRTPAIYSVSAGLVLHTLSQYGHWFSSGATVLSFLDVFSLCVLVVAGILLFSLLLEKPLFDAGLVAFPITALILLLQLLLDVPGTEIPPRSAKTTAHILSSVAAFGVLSVAGVYAFFVSLIDHFLRRHHLNRLIRNLPSLEALERLLFQLIAAGFAILTISLGTGLLFINDLFAQHLVHKTILSIVAWLVFGTLLWGRRYQGWRGRVAVRMTLAGVVLLLLSYFGTKLVLEVLLERSWQP